MSTIDNLKLALLLGGSAWVVLIAVAAFLVWHRPLRQPELEERENPWHRAVSEALVVNWIEGKYWADPRQALAALMQRAAQDAIDPAISEAAQQLILVEREACAVCAETVPWVNGRSIPSNKEIAAAIRARPSPAPPPMEPVDVEDIQAVDISAEKLADASWKTGNGLAQWTDGQLRD